MFCTPLVGIAWPVVALPGHISCPPHRHLHPLLQVLHRASHPPPSIACFSPPPLPWACTLFSHPSCCVYPRPLGLRFILIAPVVCTLASRPALYSHNRCYVHPRPALFFCFGCGRGLAPTASALPTPLSALIFQPRLSPGSLYRKFRCGHADCKPKMEWYELLSFPSA